MASDLGVTVSWEVNEAREFPMIDPVRRKEFIEAVAHKYRNGGGDWKDVFAKFTDIPRPTRYRIVNAVVARERAGTSTPGFAPEDIGGTASEAAKETTEEKPYVPFKKPGTLGPEDELPVPNEIRKLRDLYQDAIALKERSLAGNGKIKNVATFQKSIELRMKLAIAEGNLLERANNYDRLDVFYKSIMNILIQYDPKIRDQVVADLKHYNRTREKKG